MRRLEGLVQGAVEPDMEKKGLVRGFLRRDPALTQKLVFLFRKTDTKTYQFWNCRRLTGRWSCISWKSAGNDTKTYQVTFFGCRHKYAENAW